MKKFLKKIALLFVFIVGPLSILNMLYIRTNYWKWENDVYKFKNVPQQIVLANFGTSHTEHGIQYDIVPEIQTFNFGLAAQPLFYDYALLKQYSSHLAKNALVIFSISYFNVVGDVINISGTRPRYYRFLDKEYMDAWSIGDFFRYAKFPVLTAKENIMAIFHDKDDINPLYTLTKFPTEEELKKHVRRRLKEFVESSREKWEPEYQENLQAYSEMIEYCLDHSFRPVLITTPITDAFNTEYAKIDEFFDTFYRFSSELCQKYDLPYIDYSHDERFSPHHELFVDADHLNIYGAEKFTKILVSDLKERGLLQ